jgi:hypothetical protein
MKYRKSIDVIVAFYHDRKNKRLKNFKTGEVVPIRFKYKDKKVNVIVSNRYFEKINDETVIVYRCFYKERAFYYKLFFYTSQLKWELEFE